MQVRARLLPEAHRRRTLFRFTVRHGVTSAWHNVCKVLAGA
jgi:hypothetical protein